MNSRLLEGPSVRPIFPVRDLSLPGFSVHRPAGLGLTLGELKDQPNAGALTVPAGGSITFRWRLYFHYGDEKAAGIAERFQACAAGK